MTQRQRKILIELVQKRTTEKVAKIHEKYQRMIKELKDAWRKDTGLLDYENLINKRRRAVNRAIDKLKFEVDHPPIGLEGVYISTPYQVHEEPLNWHLTANSTCKYGKQLAKLREQQRTESEIHYDMQAEAVLAIELSDGKRGVAEVVDQVANDLDMDIAAIDDLDYHIKRLIG
tara:strand:+ start:1734 stop:2255 length:522 start_codon:yes stop_codon:yes gene_type:complete